MPDKATIPPNEIVKIIHRDALINARLRLLLLPAPKIILTSFDQIQHAMVNIPTALDAQDAHIKALEDLSAAITTAMQQHLMELERPMGRSLLRRE